MRFQPMIAVMLASTVLALGSGAGQAEPGVANYIASAVASPLRPDGDKSRDAAQKPGEILAFAGVRPGDRVADFWPAPPYSTRLLSLVVGPRGHVYGILPTKLMQDHPGAQATIEHDLAPFSNTTVLVQPFDRFEVPEQLDVVWMGKIYHDMPNRTEMGPLDIAAMNRAVFRALKPGGLYIIIDHSAGAGSGYLDTPSDSSQRTHRIDPRIVEAQVRAAGFELAGESRLLADADDDHKTSSLKVAQGRTDRFVFKFRKPR